MKYFGIYLLLIMMGLAACGPTYKPFTLNMQERYGWTEQQMKRIQFYLSEDVVLRRELSKGESVIDEGKISIERGVRIEEVIIPEGTPGVLQFMPKSNRMAVSFERGSKKFLMFGPHPKWGDRYMLLGSSWDKHEGEVTYQGRRYKTSSRSALAGLMVDLNRINKVTVNRRRAAGRKI